MFQDDMVTCYICMKGYHIACHEPALSTKPTSNVLYFNNYMILNELTKYSRAPNIDTATYM